MAAAGEYKTWEELTGQRVSEFTADQTNLGPQRNEDKSAWTRSDTVLEGALYILSWIDMLQTIETSRHYDDGYYEINPLLGKRPSKDKIIGANILGLTVHTYIAVKLDKPERTVWQGFWIALEAGMVLHNRSVGVSLRW